MSITFDTVSATAKASAVYLEQKGVRAGYGDVLIDQKILLLGQYNADKTPTDNVPVLLSSADDAKTLYGRGSMLALMAAKAFAAAPNNKIYACPLANHTSGVAASGSIQITHAATGAGTIALFIGGKKITVAVASGATVDTIAAAIEAAIDADLDLPVSASVSTDTVSLTAKWEGVTGDDIRLQKDLDAGDAALEPAGVTATITAMASGANNPDPTTALTALGATWYTVIACPFQDATAVPAIEAAALARAGSGVKMPFAGLIGYTGTKEDYQEAVTARNSPYVAWVPVEDSPNLPLEVAAAAAGLYGARQSIQPGTPMRYRALSGIRAGVAAAWTGTDNENTLALGGSTTKTLADGTVVIVDLATTYKTNAQSVADDTYKFVAWISNWQLKLYSLDTLFNSDPFADAIVIGNDDPPSSKDYVIRPNTVKATVIKLIDELWVPLGLTKDRDIVVAGIVAEINAANPGRIDFSVPDEFSAGLRIIAGKIIFSFTAPAVTA